MNNLSTASRVAATDLRRAERSISAATRDTAQFLVTTLDIADTHQLSPAFAQKTVKATVDALTALVEGQQQLATRAHHNLERAGTSLGLTVTDWGEGLPKPSIGLDGNAVVNAIEAKL